MHIIQEYMDFDTNGGASFHPTQDKMVFVSDRFGHYQLMEYDSKAETVTRLLETENRCTNPIYLSDGSLLFSTDNGGDEHFQLQLLSNGKLVSITESLRSKHRFAFATDTHIYYSSNKREKQRFDVYRMKIPLNESEEEFLVEGSDFLPMSPKCISQGGKLVLTKSLGNLWNEIYLLDGELLSLTSHLTEKKPRFVPVEFIDENHFLIVSDLDRDFLSLGVFSIENREITFFEDSDWDTTDVKYKDGKIYYLKNVDGSSKFYIADLSEMMLTDIKEIGAPEDLGVFVSGDFRSFLSSYVVVNGTILASFSSSTSPTNVWMYNDKWSQLTGIERDYSNYHFIEPTLERFASFDGLIVPYFFYGAGDNNLPTILIIHGGPESMYRPSFSKIVQMFLKLGFNVVAPNIRGSNGYGRLYLSLDDIEKRLDSIKDIKALADHLEEEDAVDSNRLIVYGGSYGGYSVLASITNFPERFAAAVDIVGISDLYTFLKNTAPWRRIIREVEYGYLDRDEETLKRVSPIHKVDIIITPLFIVQGDNDERVPLSESIQMYEKLCERNVKCEMLRFADEGHGVTKRKNQLVQFERIIRFLNEVLNLK